MGTALSGAKKEKIYKFGGQNLYILPITYRSRRHCIIQ